MSATTLTEFVTTITFWAIVLFIPYLLIAPSTGHTNTPTIGTPPTQGTTYTPTLAGFTKFLTRIGPTLCLSRMKLLTPRTIMAILSSFTVPTVGFTTL